jgi:hypothetical protein
METLLPEYPEAGLIQNTNNSILQYARSRIHRTSLASLTRTEGHKRAYISARKYNTEKITALRPLSLSLSLCLSYTHTQAHGQESDKH